MLSQLAPLEEHSAFPLYIHLQRALRDLMASDKLRASDFLPPERDIAKALGVSRITVRKALDGLEQEGLIERRRGSGTVVTKRLQHDFSALTSFTAEVLARGGAPRSEWLERSSAAASADETFLLGFPTGLPLYRMKRVRFADDVPMAVEHSTVPADTLAAVDAVEDSLYDAMKANGARPARAWQRLQAIVFDEALAGMIGVDVGAPGLLVERRSFDAVGRLIEVTKTYCRGDSYDFVSELTIPD
jgi:GntR family transcriptional regulator